MGLNHQVIYSNIQLENTNRFGGGERLEGLYCQKTIETYNQHAHNKMEDEEEGWHGKYGTLMASMIEETMHMVLSTVPSLRVIKVHRTPCKHQPQKQWIHFVLEKSIYVEKHT
jgi:hypothetical protein